MTEKGTNLPVATSCAWYQSSAMRSSGSTGRSTAAPRRAGIEAVRVIAGALSDLGGEHDVAMGVLDVDHALGAHDPDLEAVDRARPDHRQGPADVHAPDRAVVHREDAEGRVLGAVLAEDRIARAGIDRHRRLAFHQPQAHVEAVGAGDHWFGAAWRSAPCGS